MIHFKDLESEGCSDLSLGCRVSGTPTILVLNNSEYWVSCFLFDDSQTRFFLHWLRHLYFGDFLLLGAFFLIGLLWGLLRP